MDYRDPKLGEVGQTLNGGLASANAKIKGIAFDARAAPAPWFRVGTTFAYLDGKFTSNPTGAGSTLAYDGNARPRAPKVKLTPYVEVEAPLASGTVTARADYAFQEIGRAHV